MKKNWRTTLAGCIIGALYAGLTALQQGTVSLRDVAIAAGFGAIGALAKDWKVTGGQVQQ